MTNQNKTVVENNQINKKQNKISDIESPNETLCIGKRLCRDELEYND